MYHIKLFMKQVKLIAALLLFALGASAQTVTPDPGPYTPMNQKYEYRWIKTSGGLWNLGKFVQVDSAQFNGVTYVPSAASNDSTIKAANTGWVRRLFATASGSAGKWDTAGNAGLTDPRLGTINNSPFAIVTNNIKRLIIPAAGILPATTNAVFLVRDTLNGELKYSTSGGGDTTGLGNLYIRNTTTQENKRFNVKGGRLDTLYASTSGGGRVVSNGGTIAAEWGAGGGSNFDFHGFAGYNANRASSYTARSFTDKNYVDSISSKLIVTNRQTINYTLALTDSNKLVETNVGSGNTLTVPLNSSVAFTIGTKIDVAQYGAGQTTITATGGVTIRSYLSQLKIAGQYGAATLVKIGTDEWYCFGNLTN
jgi:hypothetical protein